MAKRCSYTQLFAELEAAMWIIGNNPKEWQEFYDNQILTADTFGTDFDPNYYLAEALASAGMVKEKTANMILQDKRKRLFLYLLILMMLPFLCLLLRYLLQ